jgi:hypothetical protein
MTPPQALTLIEAGLLRSARACQATLRPGRPRWEEARWQDLAQAWAGFTLLRDFYGEPPRRHHPGGTVPLALTALERSLQQRRHQPDRARATLGWVLIKFAPWRLPPLGGRGKGAGRSPQPFPV